MAPDPVNRGITLRSSSSAAFVLSTRRTRGKRAGGFTLIELMIVVAVVAILAAIAYPSYQDAVRKSRRGQAKADMTELSQLLERHHTVNNTYAGMTNPITQSPKTGTAHYDIVISGANAATYVLTATPQGGQTADTLCMALTLNAAGAKGENGSGTVEDCW